MRARLGLMWREGGVTGVTCSSGSFSLMGDFGTVCVSCTSQFPPKSPLLGCVRDPGFADSPLLTSPHSTFPKDCKGWLQFSACQLVRWEGNIKHSKHCLLELGKLSTPQFTLLSEIPWLTTEQNPWRTGTPSVPPPPSPPTRGDPASLFSSPKPSIVPSELQPPSDLFSLPSPPPPISSSSCLFPSNSGSFLNPPPDFVSFSSQRPGELTLQSREMGQGKVRSRHFLRDK